MCPSVCLAVRISWSIFAKSGSEVTTPKSKNEFVGRQHRTTHSPILPSKTVILGQKVLKIHANITMPISAFSVRGSPEIPAPYRKLGSRNTNFETCARLKGRHGKNTVTLVRHVDCHILQSVQWSARNINRSLKCYQFLKRNIINQCTKLSTIIA